MSILICRVPCTTTRSFEQSGSGSRITGDYREIIHPEAKYRLLTRSCYSNNQFETEARLVDDLTLHPCHTIDPEEADAFIVPVQVYIYF